MMRKPRRTKKANLVLPSIVVLLLLISSVLVGASGPPSAPALQASITSIFELDGNINDSASPGVDWSTLNRIPISTNVAPLIAHTGVIRDPAPSSIFTTAGSRDNNDISEWRHSTGAVQDKGDISNAYAAAFLAANNELFLLVGADRLESGEGTLGFWLLQKRVFAVADGTFRTGPSISDPLATHTIGDVLVLVEFSRGGLGTGRVFRWVGSGGSVGGTLDHIGLFPTGDVFGPVFFAIFNSVPEKAPWLYVPQKSPAGTIPAGGFFEGAVNVTALLGERILCNPTVVVETRSTSSVTAPLQDFVLASFRPLVSVTSVPPICQATPTTLPLSLSEGTPPYSLSATATGGLEVFLRGILIGATTPGGPPGDYQIRTTATDVNGCIGEAVTNLKIVACP